MRLASSQSQWREPENSSTARKRRENDKARSMNLMRIGMKGTLIIARDETQEYEWAPCSHNIDFRTLKSHFYLSHLLLNLSSMVEH